MRAIDLVTLRDVTSLLSREQVWLSGAYMYVHVDPIETHEPISKGIYMYMHMGLFWSHKHA